MSSHLASEVIATYALRTKDELERTLPLEGAEQLLVAFYAITEYSRSSIIRRSRTGYLRLSTTRLCVLRRYGFIRDRIIVIPPGAITNVEPEWPHGPARVSFSSEKGDAYIVIRPSGIPRREDGVVNADSLPLPFKQIIAAMRADIV
jgi:hypothetical protein